MVGWVVTASVALGSARLGLLVISVLRRGVLSILCAFVGLTIWRLLSDAPAEGS